MNRTISQVGEALRVLYIAYPLLPVSEHSAGGAEQVLWTLERQLNARGFKTTVAAAAGSQVAGELFATGNPADSVDQFEALSQEQKQRILEWLGSGALAQFDLVHDMSGWFWRHAERIELPLLASLHLPRSLYRQINFEQIPTNVAFNCVSQNQTFEFEDIAHRVIGIVRNGIALDRFAVAPTTQREYLLWLGRICEEKGTHTALDLAHAAGEKLIIAGMVYPFLYHQKYFAREVIPRLKRAGNMAKYIERPNFAEKVGLIRNAKALLITSDISETSSMVAMEAAACGTPVLALRRGALPEIIAEGVTGFLADSVKEMVESIPKTVALESARCRRYAEEHYSAEKMTDCYQALYSHVLTNAR